MGRVIFFSISMTFLYSSLTCIHIPYSVRSTFWKSSQGNLSGDFTGNFSDKLVALLPTAPEKVRDNPIETPLKETPEETTKEEYRQEEGPEINQAEAESQKAKEKTTSVEIQNPSQVTTNIYNILTPKFTRGLYISNPNANSKAFIEKIIPTAVRHHINTFVIDVQNEMIPREHVLMIKEAGIFPVARVVVFLGGLRKKTPSKDYIDHILNIMDAAAYQGFMEVQLDYIRYADNSEMEKIPLPFKYQVITSILKKAQAKANSLSIFLSADLFGRVTLNQNDQIGQKLENFSPYTDAIYPMLYPSHYTKDEYRISHPYETVKEGVLNSLKRCHNTKIIAYIQGFSWKVNQSGKNMTDYIKAQMEAVNDANGNGWIIWNARNDYQDSFLAIAALDQKSRDRLFQQSKKNRPAKAAHSIGN